MIGTALKQLLPEEVFISSADYDLRDPRATRQMYAEHKPDYVIHLAARVGGVAANYNYLADFYRDNIQINTNVLHGAHEAQTKKVVSLLSTCVYPDIVSYPLREEDIHSGAPHYSNYAYAYAKRMLDVQSRAYRKQYGCNFITAVPNNLFGENDNFDLQNSHVIPALIRKMYEAKKGNHNVTLWGDGSPLREFTYSLDLAHILLFLIDNYDDAAPINIGNTQEYSIHTVAHTIAEILQFEGEITWDTTKLNGQHRKPSDNSKLLQLGWNLQDYTNFTDALTKMCQWFILNYPNARGVK